MSTTFPVYTRVLPTIEGPTDDLVDHPTSVRITDTHGESGVSATTFLTNSP